MLHVTVRQLQVFAAVARRHSFARAAEELYLTPPAVSMQIKQLEQQLGVALFERGAGDAKLTVAGEFFLVHARKMLGSLREAEDLVARLRKVETGRVVLGMLSTAKYFVPHLLAGFLREHTGVEVTLVEGNREQLIDFVHRNEVDLAVMGRAPGELEARAEVLGAHPHGIVAPAAHPFTQLDEVTPERLNTQAFVIRESGSGGRLAMEAFFREIHARPPILMQMSSNETIKQAVMAGMGLSFLSLHTVASEIRAGELGLLRVAGLPIRRNWHVVHRRARVLSPAAEALRYHFIENGAGFLARHFAHLDQLIATMTPRAAAKRPRAATAKKAAGRRR